MQIYKICPHCGKKLFLIYEMEFSMYWAKDEFELHKKEEKKDKDTGKWPEDYEGDEEAIRFPDGYNEDIFPDRHIKEDWNAMVAFLHELQNNHGPKLHIAFDEKEMFRIKKLEKTPDGLNIVKEMANFMEPKIKERFLKEQKAREDSEREKKEKKEQEKRFKDGHDWATEMKQPLLTEVIKAMWIKKGFDFEYVNQAIVTYTILNFNDYDFAAWLRDEEKLTTPTDILNAGEVGVLRAKYNTWRGKKEPKKEPPPKPPRWNLRTWRWNGALTEGEWLKINNSDLAFIVASTLDIHQYTLDEAHEKIRNAEEWTPSDTENLPTWPEMLDEIANLYANGAKPDSFKSIDNFLKAKQYPDPMIGINLMGVPKATLLANFATSRDGNAEKEITETQLTFVKWKEYQALTTTGDGNCFFNAFSIYLVGDESLATRLRVAVCLGLLSRNLTTKADAQNHRAVLMEINEKVSKMCVRTGWDAWRELGDGVYVASLIKRPVRILYRPDVQGWDPNTKLYQEVMACGRFALSELYEEDKSNRPIYNYNEYWTIYHVNGNHFVPLIHPTIKDVIGPQGKQNWGEVIIAFYVADIKEIGTPITTNIMYELATPEKRIGLASLPHPSDTKAGNLTGYVLKEVRIGVSDLPPNGVNQIKSKGNKKIKVTMEGVVRHYTDGDNILTFEAGTKVRHITEGPKTVITAVFTSLGAVDKNNTGTDPSSFISINITEKELGKDTDGHYPQLWADETKYNGKRVSVIKFWVRFAQYDAKLAQIQALVNKTITITSENEIKAIDETHKTIEIWDDFKISEVIADFS